MDFPLITKDSFHGPNNSGPHPLHAAFRRKSEDLASPRIEPVSVKEIAPIVQRHALDFLMVFNVSHYEEDPESGADLSLNEFAEYLGIKNHAVEQPGVNVISRGDFLPLLVGSTIYTEFHHYNLHALDLPRPPSKGQINELYETALWFLEHSDGADTTFPEQSSFVLDSHDDLFLWVSSKNEHLLQAIFALNLRLCCARLLLRETG